MKIKKLVVLFLLSTLYFLLSTGIGCGKKEIKPVKRIEPVQKVAPPASATVPQPPAVPSQTAKPQVAKKITYVYQGHRFRDPFIPLTGGLVKSAKLAEKLTVTSLRSFSVKGIIEDEKEKIALLSAPGGKNYVLKEGNLIDSEGKAVPEIKGKIEKNKVIFFLADTKVELNITEENK